MLPFDARTGCTLQFQSLEILGSIEIRGTDQCRHPPVEVSRQGGETRGLSGLQLLPTVSHDLCSWAGAGEQQSCCLIRLDSPKSTIFTQPLTPQGASDSTELFSWFQMSLRRGNQLIATFCDGLITKLCLSNPPYKSKGGESPGPGRAHE